MKRLALLCSVFLLCVSSISAANIDSLLSELDKHIEKKDYYFSLKKERIKNLTQQLQKSIYQRNNNVQYEICLGLFNEYESFIYDSAFKYVEKLRTTAELIKEPAKIVNSKIRLGFVLLSSGLFKEAIDTLNEINISSIPDSVKSDYYSVLARTYYDLADYEGDNYFSNIHRQKGNELIEKACKLARPNSVDYWLHESLHRMKTNDFDGAIEAFEMLIDKYKLTDHQYAIATSSLGYLFSLKNKQSESIAMLIRAAIADIKSSVKETVALRNLSSLLYQNGDVKTAYRYIKLALDDATYYNARHRKIEIATILPIIEGEKLATVERQKELLIKYSIIITILILLVIVFAIIIFRQLRRLKYAKQVIQETNNNLTETNHKLQEANKIKEEYIGYFFNINSEYIDKIEKFQRDVNRKLTTNQIDDIKSIIKNIDLKKEREELYHSFDKIFLKLFPDFVVEFNSMFKEEDCIILKDNQLLNTDLRIFALIRMGISDNEKIAKILEYSVNTIYTYKTKIKNKSIVPNDEFEQRIMEIKAL